MVSVRNKVALSGKSIPLQICKSHFAQTSQNHRDSCSYCLWCPHSIHSMLSDCCTRIGFLYIEYNYIEIMVLSIVINALLEESLCHIHSDYWSTAQHVYVNV